ncbi:MAG: hypothetical protein WD534_04865 [Phycisphaeraceae bacterium]
MMVDWITGLTQFGVAGLMGALWVWERYLSRRREAQLEAAHRRLMSQQQQLRVLIRLVSHNTRAIERFDQTQTQLNHLLEKMHDRLPPRQAA